MSQQMVQGHIKDNLSLLIGYPPPHGHVFPYVPRKVQPSLEVEIVQPEVAILLVEPAGNGFTQQSHKLQCDKDIPRRLIVGGNKTRDIYIMASDEDITRYMDFHNGTEPLPMPGVNEVLLSAGMAEILNIQPGDTVTLRNPDLEALQLTVSGIYENHVYNYALVTPETIRAQWGREPEMQMAFVSVREGRNPNSAGAAANRLNGVINVTVSQELAKSVNTMMAAMDLVVIVVVFCAGILAVIVLYNLTNININERIREIATIKVLGFNAMETAMYVFKENLVLSVFGTAFGIPMGKFLLEFVISQIKIDLIWIKPTLAGWSLAVSIVLTILSAVAVDSIFYFKLEKINMAEALKSAE